MIVNGAQFRTDTLSVAVRRVVMPAFAMTVWGLSSCGVAAEVPSAATRFHEHIQPILETYCYNCHGYGVQEGGRTLDEFASDDAMLSDRKLWWAVLKNVRAGVMPPAGEERPNDEERQQLFDWIKFDALGIDPQNPDPGRVTLRRLNRAEYRNTIRDLMGVEFNTNDEFPADDSGYGFDNVGDVLTISPLLMEKYLQAAETIVAEAVPRKPPHPKDAYRKRKYDRFFPDGAAPDEPQARDAYARKVLSSFTRRAYRRPADEETINRLIEIAKLTYNTPGHSFEDGIANAMAAAIASASFLFRLEMVAPSTPDQIYPPIDEHSLASRLSYLLWSTMPDEELLQLADRGELRANLAGEIERMLADERSSQLAKNFVGQWLRSRDVERFEVDLQFGHELAVAMSEETELCFDHIMREDRSVLELLDSDYTFANERLAKHYGIEGVVGNKLRRVELPTDSPRGGVLTQGTLLVVTSNPMRTSPVKRGFFILDNILGTPPPPPPPDVPPLEDAAVAFSDHQPTIRELQEQHRKDPLCHSCHARMDPLGLSLENFNMLGQWRATQHGRPIDTSGELLTGEKFEDIDQLKQILKTDRRLDFYRCLTEKLLTYALGRGLDYYDEHTIDQIVAQLDREQGKFSVLLGGVVNAPAFQRQQANEAATP
jgi:hypothetical protein